QMDDDALKISITTTIESSKRKSGNKLGEIQTLRFIYQVRAYLINGGLTTVAFVGLFRILMKIWVPSLAYCMGTYPKPIDLCNVGDCVPEVTRPIASPFIFSIAYAFLGIPLSSISKPTSL